MDRGEAAKRDAMTNRDNRFREVFFDLGTQYYVAGRLAARGMLVPVHGNLFHHAIEMYLKGALVGILPIREMKQKPYSHDLTEIWKRFKAREADSALARFDPTVQALHEFESIRYPDKIVEHGMLTGVVWQAHHITTTSSSIQLPPKYEIVIATIDDLVIEVFQRASINPQFFGKSVQHGPAREALEYQNSHASQWL